MRTTVIRSVLVGLSLLVASCGGSDIIAEPLIDSTVVGSFDGTEFIPVNGYATVATTNTGDRSIIVLGTGGIGCGSESGLPPRGYTVATQIPALAVGTYSNVEVQLYSNVDRFREANDDSGTVTISSVTDDSVVGEISFEYTDTTFAAPRVYTVTGTFEVAHCAY